MHTHSWEGLSSWQGHAEEPFWEPLLLYPDLLWVAALLLFFCLDCHLPLKDLEELDPETHLEPWKDHNRLLFLLPFVHGRQRFLLIFIFHKLLIHIFSKYVHNYCSVLSKFSIPKGGGGWSTLHEATRILSSADQFTKFAGIIGSVSGQLTGCKMLRALHLGYLLNNQECWMVWGWKENAFVSILTLQEKMQLF